MDFSRFDDIQNSFLESTVYWQKKKIVGFFCLIFDEYATAFLRIGSYALESQIYVYTYL